MESKPRPHPSTYIMQKYVRVVGSFYFRDQNWRISTPERLGEHYVGYINTAIFPVLTGCQLSLRLKLMPPLKLIPPTTSAPQWQLVRSLIHRD